MGDITPAPVPDNGAPRRRLVWMTVGRWYRASWMATGVDEQRWLQPVVFHVAEALLGDGDASPVVERLGAVRAAGGFSASEALADLGALLDHLGDDGTEREELERALTRGWVAARPRPDDQYAGAQWVARRVVGRPAGDGPRRATAPVVVVVDVGGEFSEPADRVRALCVAGALLEQWFPTQRPALLSRHRLAVVADGHPGVARTVGGLRSALAHAPELAGVDTAAWLEPVGDGAGEAPAAASFAASLSERAPRAPESDEALAVRFGSAAPGTFALPRPTVRPGTRAVGVAAAALALTGLVVGAGWPAPPGPVDVTATGGSTSEHPSGADRGLTLPGAFVDGVAWPPPLPSTASTVVVRTPPGSDTPPFGGAAVPPPAPPAERTTVRPAPTPTTAPSAAPGAAERQPAAEDPPAPSTRTDPPAAPPASVSTTGSQPPAGDRDRDRPGAKRPDERRDERRDERAKRRRGSATKRDRQAGVTATERSERGGGASDRR